MTDTDDPRGFQSGYNRCNSSTETQESLCQTMFVNHIDGSSLFSFPSLVLTLYTDFCLWAPGPPNST
jgi:hypothetical protein